MGIDVHRDPYYGRIYILLLPFPRPRCSSGNRLINTLSKSFGKKVEVWKSFVKNVGLMIRGKRACENLALIFHPQETCMDNLYFGITWILKLNDRNGNGCFHFSCPDKERKNLKIRSTKFLRSTSIIIITIITKWGKI